MDPGWVVTTLRTITPNHGDLQRISLSIPLLLFYRNFHHVTFPDVRQLIGEAACKEWSDLDRLFIWLGESHSIDLKILCHVSAPVDGPKAKSRVEDLLPEVTAKGMLDLM